MGAICATGHALAGRLLYLTALTGEGQVDQSSKKDAGQQRRSQATPVTSGRKKELATHSTTVSPPGRHRLIRTAFVGLLYIAGNISSASYPIFVTSMIGGGQATTSQVGVLATAEFLPFGLAILCSGRFLPERHLRLIAGVCLVIQLICAYASSKLSFGLLVPCRALFAVAGGILVWLAYAYVARAKHPGRLVAIYTTILLTVSMVFSRVAPGLILPTFGHGGVIMFLAVSSALGLGLLAYGPSELEALPESLDEHGVTVRGWVPAGSLLVLLSVAAWAVFMSIFWVYSAPIAQLHMGELIKNWLTISIVAQIIGSALAAVLAERLPHRATVTCGLILSILQIGSILVGVSSIGFLACSAAFGFFAYFLATFFVASLIETDPSRRSVVYFPAAQFIAGGLGPLLASQFVTGADLKAGLMIDLAAIAIAPVLFWGGILIHRRMRQPTLRPALSR
jgi:MFS family permease